MITRNPFDSCVLPKKEVKKRDIWMIEDIQKALDNCTVSKLYIAINLAFACSFRIGEILGLTWDNVYISEEAIANDDAYIYVEKELRGVSLRAMEVLNKKDVYTIIPPVMNDTTTRLVLKNPKTVAYILLEWKKSQEKWKEILGEEYQDYNLVIALENGRPCENQKVVRFLISKIHI